MLLAEAKAGGDISSPKPFTAVDARGETYNLPPGDRLTVGPQALHERTGP